MADIATLGLKIDATGAAVATESLDEMTAAGKRAEDTFRDLERASSREASSAGAAARAAEKAAEEYRKVARETETLADAHEEVGRQSEWVARQLEEMRRATGLSSTAAEEAAGATLRQTLAMVAGRAAIAGVTAALLAAAAAVTVFAAAWKQRQRDLAEAREEIERVNRSLDALREKQRIDALGPGGEWVDPLRQANEELERMLSVTPGILSQFREIGGTIVQMVAGAEDFWDLFRKGFEASDTAKSLREIRDLVLFIDEKTGGRLAKQIELNRAQAIEAQQARIHAGNVERLNAWLDDQTRNQATQIRLRAEWNRQAEQSAAAAARAFDAEISNLERGAELRLLSAEHVLRALEIEEEQRAIAKDVNRTLEDRIRAQERLNRLAAVTGGALTPYVVSGSGFDPSSNAGMILTAQAARSAAPEFTFEVPAEEEIERLRDASWMLGDVAGAAGDLATALEPLSPLLADLLRGVEDLASGASRGVYGLAQGGIAGGLNAFSGGLQIGGSVASIVDSIFGGDSRAAATRAEMVRGTERATEALRELAEAIRGVTEEERRRSAAASLLNSGIASAAGWENASGLEAFVDSAKEAGWSVDQMVSWLVAEHNIRQEMIPGLRELIAAYIDNIDAINEWKAASAAALAEEEEARRKAEEAAKAQSIANFDVEISARRAAQAGDELAAMQIRGEAAIAAQVAEWQKLVESGHMTQEQLEELSDIMRIDLAESIEAAAEAARKASEDFLGMLAVEDLMAMGNTTDARILQAEQREANWIEQLNKLDLTAEEYDQAMETIGRITRNTIDNILADAAKAEAHARDVRVAESADAVTRNARSITSMQAQAMVDILWSINAGVQEVASNTRGGGATFGGGGGQTTVYDTGAETHVHYHIGPVNVAGSVVGIPDITRAIIADVDRELGGLNADATQATGTVLL